MLLATIGTGFLPGRVGSIPSAHRRFLLAAIRSALLSRHPELQASASAGLGVVEMHLEPIVALAQRGLMSRMTTPLGESLDEHLCPHCIYKAPSGECDLCAGATDHAGGCMIRRYGPTIFAAARDALLKLAGGERLVEKP